jgi:hypothetical protein
MKSQTGRGREIGEGLVRMRRFPQIRHNWDTWRELDTFG